jgi:hypothetical protein
MLIPSVLLWAGSCANIVPPEGGPRDTRPPQVLQSVPEDRSLHFQSPEIRIYFDEFVALKDVAAQLFISPPLDKSPELRIRGKSVIVFLNDSLRANTTYTLYFGSAIRDITEGNVLEDFTFSFSTGAIRDSLQLEGSLHDALSGEAVKDALICLYSGKEDSLFTTRRPDYITRSRADGSFSVYNLPSGPFRVYALQDANNNQYYDLPNEAIAFDTSLFFPSTPPGLPKDTLAFPAPDSLVQEQGAETDSLLTEALLPLEDSVTPKPGPSFAALRMFTDQDTTQMLLKAGVPRSRHIELAFRNPLQSFSFDITDTLYPRDAVWLIPTAGKDTMNLWFAEPVGDSLHLIIREGERWKDTLQLRMAERKSGRGSAGKSASPQGPGLKPQLNVKNKANLFRPVEIRSLYPVAGFKPEQIRILSEYDTLSAESLEESADRRSLRLAYPFKQGMNYEIICDDSAFWDIRGIYSDSVAFRFGTLKEDDLGSLFITLEGMADRVLMAELLDAQGAVKRRLGPLTDNELAFPQLEPAKYRLRVYHDSQTNGRWDPGFFPARIQAEKVYYYPSELNVRAKWELRENWEIPE